MKNGMIDYREENGSAPRDFLNGARDRVWYPERSGETGFRDPRYDLPLPRIGRPSWFVWELIELPKAGPDLIEELPCVKR